MILQPEQQLLLWGRLVEMLLQSCMFFNRKPAVWDALVLHVLIWQSLQGDKADDMDISEWTRKEVIANLQTSS